VDWHAALIRTVIGPLWARWEKSPYLRHLRWLRRSQFDTPEAIRDRQWAALRELLHHAYATVPFYRERFDRAAIHPDQIRDFADFGRLPVLTKDDIRQHGDALFSRGSDPTTLHRKKTSGSTGVPLEIHLDEAGLQWKRACTLRSNEWSGWRFGERVGILWGQPEYLERGWRGRLRNALLDRERYLDTLKIDKDGLAAFARDLHCRPPSLLYGHAHSVYLFAEYLRGAQHLPIRPHGIITTAMVLHDWQRRSIEEVFGCPVTNRYGCEEVSLIACECERHDGLHINADSVYVELERAGRPVASGEPGSILVTDLANRAMPLLRYQIGDVGTATERSCPCGRGLPLLERVEGREADYVVTPSGRLISGISLTDHFGAAIPGAVQVQIVQETPAAFRFRIVRGPDFGPRSLERIGELVGEWFGPGITYECDFVERILPESSGKYRFCISRVANPFTRPQEAAIS
jgi:phenylacetate-CoA ligase